MQLLFSEGLAFGISILAFFYGLITVFRTRAPLYFKLIICAVGCYALEELWVIINVVCSIGSGVFSVRLLGIFGCFCTFLTASKVLNKDLFKKRDKKRLADIAVFAVPLVLAALGVWGVWYAVSDRTVFRVAVVFLVLLPAVWDSYYETKFAFAHADDDGHVAAIRPIALLVILEYILSFLYCYFLYKGIGLMTDVVSALLMAIMVIFCRKGAAKWKT